MPPRLPLAHLASVPPELVAIGTSTGGPVALQSLLSGLAADFPLPLLMILHMPASFTAAFAERLDQQCAITVKEAEEGDVLRPGLALVAPGGRQLLIECEGDQARVRLQAGLAEQPYQPSVDITFASLAEDYPGKVLGLILTGMGIDGCEGARRLVQEGSEVWAQDEASCVVYGMPAAVVEAGLASRILPLSAMAEALAECAQSPVPAP